MIELGWITKGTESDEDALSISFPGCPGVLEVINSTIDLITCIHGVAVIKYYARDNVVVEDSKGAVLYKGSIVGAAHYANCYDLDEEFDIGMEGAHDYDHVK